MERLPYEKTLSKGVERMLSGFAAGVMVAYGAFNSAIESSAYGQIAFMPAVIGIFDARVLISATYDHVIRICMLLPVEVKGLKS